VRLCGQYRHCRNILYTHSRWYTDELLHLTAHLYFALAFWCFCVYTLSPAHAMPLWTLHTHTYTHTHTLSPAHAMPMCLCDCADSMCVCVNVCVYDIHHIYHKYTHTHIHTYTHTYVYRCCGTLVCTWCAQNAHAPRRRGKERCCLVVLSFVVYCYAL
jgi:hypothetical protein